MAQTIELRCCYHANQSQLSFTSQIRRQVKKLCPKPKMPSDDGSYSSDVTVTLTEVGRTGNERRSAEIVYGSDDSCTDIYLRILTALCAFERASRNLLVPLLLALVPNHLENIYDRFVDREIFHIALVRQVAKAVALETGKTHDHTKDAFYTFVTCGKYGGIGAEGRQGFDSVFAEEVNRHFSLEAHHPEFERFRQTECRDCDIQEMAIDRLSRNTVASNGKIDRNTMERYLPQFELSDVDRKLALYKETALKLESIVIEEHRKLQTTYSQGQGQAPAEVFPDHLGACSNDCLNAKIYILAPNKLRIELQSLK